MVSVRVIWESSGKPASGQRVCVGFDGIFRGMTKEVFTDSSGDVNFDNDPGTGEVYVNGSKKYTGNISGRTVVYI